MDGPATASDPNAADHTTTASGIEALSGGRPVRDGELVMSWRIASIAVWALVVFAYSTVWKTSVELGIGTWWLGARSSPQPIYIRLIPFAVAIGFGLLSTYPIRRLPLINTFGALVFVAIAIPDFSRSIGLASIELVIAGAILLVALGSFTGVVKTVDR
jgi:hypothetical protein